MPLLIISALSVLFAQTGPSCEEYLHQISQKILDQKKVEAESEKLEDELKIALQNEITAQVEKRDSSTEQGRATEIYYQLRKVRVQKEHEVRALKNLQKEHCRVCPESKSCSEVRNRS